MHEVGWFWKGSALKIVRMHHPTFETRDGFPRAHIPEQWWRGYWGWTDGRKERISRKKGRVEAHMRKLLLNLETVKRYFKPFYPLWEYLWLSVSTVGFFLLIGNPLIHRSNGWSTSAFTKRKAWFPGIHKHRSLWKKRTVKIGVK